MTADLSPSEGKADSADFGNDGLYRSPASEEAAPLKVQLGEHLDSVTKRSLQGTRISKGDFGSEGHSFSSFLKRYPLPLLLTLGGAIWLWTSRSGRRA